MHNLINADEVIRIAFPGNSQVDPDAISDFCIECAQLKFIAPALGKLYASLTQGEYPDLNENYIKPALAFFVKYSVLPEMSVRIGNSGIVRGKTAGSESVGGGELSRLRGESKETGILLLKKALAHIEACPEEYPEYERRNGVSVNGGIVI